MAQIMLTEPGQGISRFVNLALQFLPERREQIEFGPTWASWLN